MPLQLVPQSVEGGHDTAVHFDDTALQFRDVRVRTVGRVTPGARAVKRRVFKSTRLNSSSTPKVRGITPRIRNRLDVQ